MPRKLTDVITEDEIRDLMTKKVFRSRYEDLANRRIADPADRAAFVEEEISLTDEDKQTDEDIALLLARNPTR